MPVKLKAVVSGWYGAPNVGDELLFATVKKYADQADVELVAISVDPDLTRAMHGVQAVDYHNLGAIAHAMLDADLFIMGGGGIFQDHHGFRIKALYDPLVADMAGYARPFFMARQLGLRTVIWGHGVGPLSSQEARAITRSVFSQADHVSVRDEASAQLLHEIGVQRDIPVGPDPAWLNMTPAESAQPIGESNRILALIVREWPYENGWYSALVQAVRKAVKAPWRCKLIGFQPRNVAGRVISDLPFLERLREDLDDVVECAIVGEGNPKNVLPHLRACDAVLSMRLHGTMLALACGKPTAVIEYDAKLGHLDDMVGMNPDLRVRLDSPVSAYVSMLEHLINTSAAEPVSMETLLRMRDEAGVHAGLLESAFATARERGRLERDWPSDGFNWLATWLQQSISSNAVLASQHAEGLELLRFRDRQLSQLEQKAEEMEQAKVVMEQQRAELSEKHVRELELLKFRDYQLSQLEQKVGEMEQAKIVMEQQRAELAELHAKGLELLKFRDHQLFRLEQQRAELDVLRADAEDLRSRLQNVEIDLQERETLLQDKEGYIAQLRADLEAARRGFWPRFQVLVKGLSRAPMKARSAMRIFRSDGFRGVRKALEDRRRPDYRQLSTQGNGVVVVTPTAAPTMKAGSSDFAALFKRDLVLFSPLAYAPGATHRHAQLAEAALGTGRRVVYFYVGGHGPDQLTPGMISVATQGKSAADLLSHVSPQSCIVVACASIHVLECLRLAQVQGAHLIMDAVLSPEFDLYMENESWSQLLGMADRCVAVNPAVADVLTAAGARNVEILANAASHVYFDVYKTHPRPAGMGDGRNAVIYMPAGTHDIDWKLVDRLCTACPDGHIHVVGSGEAGHVQHAPNLIMHGDCPAPMAAAFLAAADLVVLPCVVGAENHPQNGLGGYAGIFMQKPVVTNIDFRIPESPLLTVCTGEESMIGACMDWLQASSQDHDIDDFVMANTWLARLEQLFGGTGKNNVSVVVLIHNNADIIGRCIRSMQMHAASYLAELIVVDNASSDGGAEYVEKTFPEVRLLRNPKNGCSSGRNLGARHCKGEYIAFFDSDQWLAGGAGFGEALAVLERNAGVGTVGWNAGWFDARREDLGGPIADYIPNRAMNDAAMREGFRTDIGFLGTSGMFLRRSLFEQLDGFDTFYDPTCFEDTDICFQIKQYGLQVAYRDLSGIRHQPHQTTGADSGSDRYWKLFNRNADYFREKWKAHSDFFLDYTP